MPALLAGQIYRHTSFYVDHTTGRTLPKFLVVLAHTPGGDAVARLLTSRPHGRPEHPACYHGHPYPSYYLGVLGGELGSKSWVDLKYLDDLDDAGAARLLRDGRLTASQSLAEPVMRPLLECAATADDTTRLQERAIRDQLATLR